MTLPNRAGVAARVRRALTPRRVAAALLFAFVFVYRFNALGGSFGGFDNDHFLQFALAKQVEAGAQPLRDFSDAVQGARPSLTYELSAAAQRWLGDSFLAEALLTVTAVAVAAVVTFAVAARLAPWPWALVLTLLSVLLSPKLYAYPKVLVLAVAALLMVRYAHRPGRGGAVALGVWLAVAFLFRHDYAVYCGAGVAALLLVAHLGDATTLVRRAALCAGVAVVLLLPSVAWVQYYAGLSEYVRNALEISAREAERTRLHDWPALDLEGVGSLLGFFGRGENARAWIYYTLLGLSWVGALTVGVRLARRGRAADEWTAAVAGLTALAAVSTKFFLRGNLDARFSEVAPASAVLAAALIGAWVARGESSMPTRVARHAAAAVLVAATALSVVVLQNVPAEYLSARLNTPVSAARQAAGVFGELRVLPGEMREHGPANRMQAADYLHRCTRQTDRVLVFAYAPEIAVFAERLFAGGRAVFAYGYYAREKYSRDALAWLARESVPIIIAEPHEKTVLYEQFPLLAEYFRSHYDDVGSVMMSEGVFRVLARRASVPTGRGVNGLPCYS